MLKELWWWFSSSARSTKYSSRTWKWSRSIWSWTGSTTNWLPTTTQVPWTSTTTKFFSSHSKPNTRRISIYPWLSSWPTASTRILSTRTSCSKYIHILFLIISFVFDIIQIFILESRISTNKCSWCLFWERDATTSATTSPRFR